MTIKDKTREKLLSSMRKTKEVISDQPESRQAHAETYAPPVKTPARAEIKEKSDTLGQKLPSRAVSSTDPYQSRGRIWPD